MNSNSNSRGYSNNSSTAQRQNNFQQGNGGNNITQQKLIDAQNVLEIIKQYPDIQSTYIIQRPFAIFIYVDPAIQRKKQEFQSQFQNLSKKVQVKDVYSNLGKGGMREFIADQLDKNYTFRQNDIFYIDSEYNMVEIGNDNAADLPYLTEQEQIKKTVQKVEIVNVDDDQNKLYYGQFKQPQSVQLSNKQQLLHQNPARQESPINFQNYKRKQQQQQAQCIDTTHEQMLQYKASYEKLLLQQQQQQNVPVDQDFEFKEIQHSKKVKKTTDIEKINQFKQALIDDNVTIKGVQPPQTLIPSEDQAQQQSIALIDSYNVSEFKDLYLTPETMYRMEQHLFAVQQIVADPKFANIAQPGLSARINRGILQIMQSRKIMDVGSADYLRENAVKIALLKQLYKIEMFKGRLVQARLLQGSTLNGNPGYSYGSFLLTVQQFIPEEDPTKVFIQPENQKVFNTLSLDDLVMGFCRANQILNKENELISILGVSDMGKESKIKHYHVALTFSIRRHQKFAKTMLIQLINCLKAKYRENLAIKIVPKMLTDQSIMGKLFDVKAHSIDLVAFNYIQWKILERLDLLLIKPDEGLPVWWEKPSLSIMPEFGAKLEQALLTQGNNRSAEKIQAVVFENIMKSRDDSLHVDKYMELINVGGTSGQYFTAGKSKIQTVGQSEFENKYAIKENANPLKSVAFCKDLLEGRFLAENMPINYQAMYGPKIKQFLSFYPNLKPVSFINYFKEENLFDQEIWEFVQSTDYGKKFIALLDNLFQTIAGEYQGPECSDFVQWLQNIAVPPAEQQNYRAIRKISIQQQGKQQIITENEPCRTILFIYGRSGIGKSYFYDQIIRGQLKDFSIKMNSSAFQSAASAQQAVKSTTEYAFYVNHEASVDEKHKLDWAEIKKMWEARSFINIKNGGITAPEGGYRMPFIYIFNQNRQEVWDIISKGDMAEDVLNSLKNRVLHLEFANQQNDIILKDLPNKAGICTLNDLHRIFWMYCINKFRVGKQFENYVNQQQVETALQKMINEKKQKCRQAGAEPNMQQQTIKVATGSAPPSTVTSAIKQPNKDNVLDLSTNSMLCSEEPLKITLDDDLLLQQNELNFNFQDADYRTTISQFQQQQQNQMEEEKQFRSANKENQPLNQCDDNENYDDEDSDSIRSHYLPKKSQQESEIENIFEDVEEEEVTQQKPKKKKKKNIKEKVDDQIDAFADN